MSLKPHFILSVALLYSAASMARAVNCPLGGTTIFFGNGLDTDFGTAVISTDALRSALFNRLTATGNTMDPACLNFIPAYDAKFFNTHNNKQLTWIQRIAQYIDAAEQRSVELTPTLLWDYFNGVESPPQWFSDIVLSGLTDATDVVHQDLLAQELFYKNALRNNGVIIVAHSQGNFYANAAYADLGAPPNFAIIAVASPSANVPPGGGRWFTLYGDIIKTVVPGSLSLSANIRNDAPSPCLDAGISLAGISAEIACHSFDASYMGWNIVGQITNPGLGDNTRPAILDAIIAAIPFSNPGPAVVAVGATLDGNAWPPSGTAASMYTVAGPRNVAIGQAVPSSSSVVAGQYRLDYQSGGPSNSFFSGISPCGASSLSPAECNQTVDANETFVFTLRFVSNPPVAGFTMSSDGQPVMNGQQLSVNAVASGTASVNFNAAPSIAFNTNMITAWQWTIDNAVVATKQMFTEGLSVGMHSVSLVVTDSRGVPSTAATGTVVVTQQPIAGTVTVQATLNGVHWPSSGTASLSYTMACGPQSITGITVPSTGSNISPGSCTLIYTGGGPPSSTFSSVTPSFTQTVATGQTIAYTLNFYSIAPAKAYTLTDLGWNGSGPGGAAYFAVINNNGQAAGSGGAGGSIYNPIHGFLYSNGITTDVGSLGGYPTYVYGMNNVGQVVGSATTASGGTHAFLYSGGNMTDLGTLPGGSSSEASAINSSGQVVGQSTAANGVVHAFLYSASTGIVDLNAAVGGYTSSAQGINDQGQVVGYFTTSGGNGGPYLFLYSGGTGGTSTTLGQIIGANPALGFSPIRINNSGEILVGSTATLYSGGVTTAIAPFPGDTGNAAFALNNLGQVVAESGAGGPCCRGYLYSTTKGLIDITALNVTPPKTTIFAWGINDSGQLVVWGGEEYLLTPVP